MFGAHVRRNTGGGCTFFYVTCEKTDGKLLAIGSMRTSEAKFPVGMGKGKVLATGSMAHHEGNMQTETRELAPMSSISTLLALSDGMQGSMQTETSERDPGKELTIGNIGMRPSLRTGQELASGSMARYDETRELAPSSLVFKLLALSDDMAQ